MPAKLFCIAAMLLGILCACNNTGTTSYENDSITPVNSYSKPESKNEEMAMEAPVPGQPHSEETSNVTENKFMRPDREPLSTFSIDVDEAAYSHVRSYIQHGELPPPHTVRIEEMINYFDYTYPQPQNDDAFSITTELGECPWNSKHQLLHIGLKGKEIATDNLPPSNMVFLVDVSGSMSEPNKLPLVQASMKMLVQKLRPTDRVAIVVYAGSAGLVLPSTPGTEKNKIKNAIDQLEAGGSTAGGEGIELAYAEATKNFIREGNNRIILATDGDFNVGVSSEDELVRLIEKKRETGVFLSVLGFGRGNYMDNKMQLLADRGNGNHSYIDNLQEASKVLVKEFGSTLFTIASDVKIQVEFNPASVAGYRLIGYENRMLDDVDFNDDKKDAGEIGSGHTVTALYEIIPANGSPLVDDLKYQAVAKPVNANKIDELMTLKLRYKKPGESASKLIVHPVGTVQTSKSQLSDNFRFSAAVASYGMLLRHSSYKADATFDNTIALAKKAKGTDDEGYRNEFIKLVETTSNLMP